MTEATTERKSAYKHINKLQKSISKDEVLTQFLGTTVSLPLSILLASSPVLAKSMVDKCQKHRVPIADLTHQAYQTMESPPGTVLEGFRVSRDPLLSKPLGRLKLTINGRATQAVVDGGSQINVMSNALRQELGIPVSYMSGHFL